MPELLRAARGWHKPLLATALVSAAVVVVSAAGLLLDDRILLGAPIWLKPLKFGISFVAYSLSIAWLLTLTSRAPRLRWWLGTGIVAMSFAELAAIVGQTVRGVPSHFNNVTAFDAWVWRIMGSSIVVLWVLTIGLAVLLLFERGLDRVPGLAVRLGLAVSVVGMGLAFLMALPTSAQLDQMERGNSSIMTGAHAVGVPDGGPGMPLTGWSLTGGDLRIGHFFGMHALQALPLLMLLLGALARRHPGRFTARARYGLVWVGGLTWAGIMLLSTWQALRGQPLLRPDALTGLVALGLLAAALLGGWFAMRRPGRDEAAVEVAAPVPPADSKPPEPVG